MSVENPAASRSESLPHARERTTSRSIAIDWAMVALCVLVFAMAIVPRAAWVAYNDRAPQGLNDPTIYMFVGDIMADGGGYTRPTGEPFAYYPVGFPATVAGLKKAHDIVGLDRDVFSVKMMNGVFGAITTVLVFLLASRLVNRRTGLAAAALHAIFPSQIFYTGTILSEPEFTMLFMLAMVILAWDPWEREGMSYTRLAIAGLVLSAATMTRGITLIFPLVLLGIWFFYLHSKQRALLQTLVLFAGIAVLIVPWSIRNSIRFDTIVGPSTNLGDDLCIGNFDGSDGRFTITGKCFEGHEGLSPKEVEIKRNREGVRIAIEDVLSSPERMPKLVALKAYWLLYKDDDGLWAAESYGNDWFISQPRRDILSFAANSIYYATGALVLLGAAAFAFSRDIRRAFALIAMLYILAVPLAFFGDPRFHYPAMPLAIIIAGATVIAFWDRRRWLGAKAGGGA